MNFRIGYWRLGIDWVYIYIILNICSFIVMLYYNLLSSSIIIIIIIILFIYLFNPTVRPQLCQALSVHVTTAEHQHMQETLDSWNRTLYICCWSPDLDRSDNTPHIHGQVGQIWPYHIGRGNQCLRSFSYVEFDHHHHHCSHRSWPLMLLLSTKQLLLQWLVAVVHYWLRNV